jgi:hypothetical protein
MKKLRSDVIRSAIFLTRVMQECMVSSAQGRSREEIRLLTCKMFENGVHLASTFVLTTKPSQG